MLKKGTFLKVSFRESVTSQNQSIARIKEGSTTSNADINFEQELRKAANEQRGGIAENQYKAYVSLEKMSTNEFWSGIGGDEVGL